MAVKTLVEQLYDHNRKKTALIIEGATITYEQLINGIEQRKDQLKSVAKGKIKGKVIALQLENGLPFIEWFYAIVDLGGIALPFPVGFTEDERLRNLMRFEPLCLITVEEVTKLNFSGESRIEMQHTSVKVDYPFYISLSSGSTGKPKGIIRTQRSWLDSFVCMSKSFQLSSKDIILIPGPLCYSASLISLLHMLSLGGTAYVLKKFSKDHVLQGLDMVTTAFMVPTMYQMIIDQLDKNEDCIVPQNLRSIITAGAKMNVQLKDKLKQYFPQVILYEYFGSAEQGFISYITNEESSEKQQTVGRLFPSTEVKIEEGAIFVRSPYTARSYWGMDDSWQGNWLTVGDQGYFDSDGYLHYVGRKEQMIISGGINVYPLEIERVLEEIEGVSCAAIIGLADKVWGEKIVAVIQGDKAFADKIEKECQHRFSAAKRPREFYFIDSLPKLVNGKIDRKKIKQMMEAEMTWNGSY
ncbi:AMP-binding protein [Anaerobacillus sp. MEB173]|uniref:AMP-binding protein n=1 Tax=Anaerobacillus sp. MEB173 TaxID=3383345 RepID=UPI003F91E614